MHLSDYPLSFKPTREMIRLKEDRLHKLLFTAILLPYLSGICMAQGRTDSTRHRFKLALAVKTRKPDNNKKLTFGFNYGYSYPVGSFLKTDPSKYPISRFTKQDTSQLGGYAKYGFHYEYYVTYKIMRHVSIMLSVNGSDLGYNITALNAQYIQFFPPNTLVITSGDSYDVVQYLAGPSFNLPLGKKFSIEVKALAGLTSTNYPTLSYTGGLESSVYSFSQGTGVGYNAGVGIKYIAADGLIGVHFNICYAGANINFSNYSITYYTPNSAIPANSAIFLGSTNYNVVKSLPIGMIQATFGITAEL